MRGGYKSRTIEALGHLGTFKTMFGDEKGSHTDLWMQLIEEGESIFDRKNMRGHITATMMILDESKTETLLIHHKHHEIWLPPGGHVEEGTLLENALREAEEETGLVGIRPLLDHPIHIDTHPITARPSKNEGEHFHHDMLFLGVSPTKKVVHQEEEVFEAVWRSLREVAQGSDHAGKGAQNALKVIG